MHWSETICDILIRRGGEPVIGTGTSISGVPHIGNASDVIRGDAIRKVLRERNLRPRLIWLSDDSDPFRKVPRGLETLSEYLGYPVINIPDPYGCHKNFVEHFKTGFIEELKNFGVNPEVISGSELYRSGVLYDSILVVMKHSKTIIDILNKFRQAPLSYDTILWNPICERCGKISTVVPVRWDGGNSVEYECKDKIVSGRLVKGCGYRGVSDLKKGFGKLPWRVEWAIKWVHFGVTCEPLGKEHASAGGSFETSKLICEEVFGKKAPLPVVYEFFTLNGEKISSSKGNVITLSQWAEIAEPEVMKYLMYKLIKKQRDIDLTKIPNLTDEYDEAERIFFGTGGQDSDLKKTYQLAQIDDDTDPVGLNVPFTLCAILSQIPNLSDDSLTARVSRLGYSNFDKNRLKRRIKVAGNWVKKYGPTYLRFNIIDDMQAEKLKDELNVNEIEALKILGEEIDRPITPNELHKRIYQIARENRIEPERLFRAIYLVLIGEEKGPKAAAFLLSLDPGLIRRRFC